MKKVLFPFLILICLCACQKDFNEWEDTEQRRVTFSFSPNGCLSTVLVATDDGFSTNMLNQLDPEYKIRIEGYCYDLGNNLICQANGFTDLNDEVSLCFMHLHCDSTYQFHFVADIVKYNSDFDYFETWYQLNAPKFNKLYLTSFEQHFQAELNMLFKADSTLMPANQTIALSLEPITYNGFIVFTNLDGIDKLDGYTEKRQSFILKTFRGIKNVQNTYQFHHTTESAAALPITACYSDNVIKVRVQTTTVTGQNHKTLTINDSEHRPFVATINCKTLSLESLTLY